MHPKGSWLLGIEWEVALNIDTALPFGLRSAPKKFNAIANAIEWMARQQGITHIFHYLDDFLIVGDPDSSEREDHLATLLSIFDHLKIPVAPEKLKGLSTKLIIPGSGDQYRRNDPQPPPTKAEGAALD